MWLLIWWSLEIYIIINFWIRRINRRNTYINKKNYKKLKKYTLFFFVVRIQISCYTYKQW